MTAIKLLIVLCLAVPLGWVGSAAMKRLGVPRRWGILWMLLVFGIGAIVGRL